MYQVGFAENFEKELERNERKTVCAVLEPYDPRHSLLHLEKRIKGEAAQMVRMLHKEGTPKSEHHPCWCAAAYDISIAGPPGQTLPSSEIISAAYVLAMHTYTVCHVWRICAAAQY